MHLNKLIVALFSMEGADLSVKADKVRNDIRWGREVDPVGDIPVENRPDFAALHAEAEAMGEAFDAAWAAFQRTRKSNYNALCELWQAGDYNGMVKLMESAPTLNMDGGGEEDRQSYE